MKLINGKISEFKKILIFGKHHIATTFLTTFNIDPESVIGFVETKKSASTYKGTLEKFDGKPIYSIDEVKNLDFDQIFIANRYFVTLEQCLQIGIPDEKIAICDTAVFEQCQLKYPDKDIKFFGQMVMTNRIRDFQTIDEHLIQSNNDVLFFSKDYVRTGTLTLLAKEIYNKKIPGDVAEFGVLRGDFAKFINELFPDRTLHLFDSFEDKSDEEIAQYDFFKDIGINFDMNIYRNTSVDSVMSKMKYPDKVEIHKGYFPDTIPTEEKIYSYVEIDIGPYQTTFDSLKYFYPRLSAGGFIMLHCYNLIEYEKDMSRAFNELEKEFGRILKVPIPDSYGTAVITK